MKTRLFQILLALLLLPALIGCFEEKPNPPSSTPITPTDFVGVWVLIPLEVSSDTNHKTETKTLLLHASNAEKPSTPSGTFMDGDVDKRMNVKGTATDDTFIGTFAIPKLVSWSGTIRLTILQPGLASVVIDNTNYKGLKRTR